MPLSEYSIYDFILKIYKSSGVECGKFSIKTSDLVAHFKVSRQFLSRMLSILVKKGYLIKHGKTKNSKYTICLRDIIL